jgi:lysozyme
MILKSPIAGIDISFWEPAELIDWDDMPQEVKVVIVKASELDWVDPDVGLHCANLAPRNFKRGLYHFLHENDIEKQINTFLRVASDVGALVDGKWLFEVPPVLDIEVAYKKKGLNAQTQIWAWLYAVERATDVRPVIYTNQNYWNNYVCIWDRKKWKLIAPEWTADYPLWVAQYPYRPDLVSKPGKLPLGWTDWVGWQYSAAYKFDAILHNGCDVNLIKEDWYKTL